MGLQFAVLLSLVALLAGCDRRAPARPAGPDSPQDCWQKVQAAVAGKDYPALFDLLSSRDQAALADDLQQLRKLKPPEQQAAAEKLKLSTEQFSALDGRDYFIHLCQAASEKTPTSRLAAAKLEKIEQTAASAKLFLKAANGGQTILLCVREPVDSAAGQEYGWFLMLYSR